MATCATREHRRSSLPRIAYMPQGLGRNLYPTLSVFENLDFFGRLFGQSKAERAQRIAELLAATGLDPFPDRPAGKLSGGMKQKLSLCCSLIHDPDLLILDEPTTGVDPLSRRQFWELIDRIRARRPGMSVIVATAYMEEAERFDWLAAMDDGPGDRQRHAGGTDGARPRQPRSTTRSSTFCRRAKRAGHEAVIVRPRRTVAGPPAIEAEGLTQPLRQVHRRRSRQLPHRARRDLRVSRLQRLRQEHDDENAHRLAGPDRRRGATFRPSARCRRHGDAPARRLHVAGLLALQRTDRAAEPGAACRICSTCPRTAERRASRKCSSGSICSALRTAGPKACPWGRSSAFSSPSRSCTGPRC